MIFIASHINIDEKKIQFKFVRAQGPGGQNVNKVATAVQLRFDIQLLPEDVQMRLRKIARNKITVDKEIIITAQRFRTQEMNRQDAVNKLIALIRQAAIKPKTRRKTKPTLAAKQRRLEKKQRRGKIKQLRKKNISNEF